MTRPVLFLFLAPAVLASPEHEGATVTGRLFRADGRPAAGRLIHLLALDQSLERRAASDAKGCFECRLPRAGRWLIVPADSDMTAAERSDADARRRRAEKHPREFHVLRAGERRNLMMRLPPFVRPRIVVTHRGRPFAGVQVRLFSADGRDRWVGNAGTSTTNAAGMATLPAARPGRYELFLRVRGWELTRGPIVVGSRPVRVVLGEATVRIESAVGWGAVPLRIADGEETEFTALVRLPVEVPFVHPGLVLIEAAPHFFELGGLHDVVPGRNTIALEVPEHGTLRVATPPGPARTLRVRRVRADAERESVVRSRAVRIPSGEPFALALPPGRYELRLARPDVRWSQEARVVTVARGGTCSVRLFDRQPVLLGTVVDAAGRTVFGARLNMHRLDRPWRCEESVPVCSGAKGDFEVRLGPGLWAVVSSHVPLPDPGNDARDWARANALALADLRDVRHRRVECRLRGIQAPIRVLHRGKPVRGARVHPDGAPTNGHGRTRTGILPPGFRRLTVRAGAWSVENVAAELEAAETDVVLPPHEVRLTGPAGWALNGPVRVVARGAGAWSPAVSGESALPCVLPYLPVGAIRVEVTAGFFTWSRLIQVRPGATWTLPVPRFGTIDVRIGQGVSQSYTLAAASGPADPLTGRRKVRVPPGRYRLRGHDRDGPFVVAVCAVAGKTTSVLLERPRG